MTALGSEPDHTPLGARLRERTGQMAPDDAEYGYAHAHLSEALAQPLLQLQEAFDPVDAAPFETILDPARCPEWALPWLAQLVGIALPTTGTPADARAAIAGLASHKRGSPAALEAAASQFLTGDKVVYFRERDPDSADPPYTLEVVTLASETPDPTAVLDALMLQKPGGIVLDYHTVAGWDYQAMTTRGGTYAALAAAYATYETLTLDEVTT